MATLDSLEQLFQDELKDIYDAEKQLTKALPKLAKKATSDELRTAIEGHLQQTEQHVERLEQAFDHLGLPARGKTCKGMKNLIAEGNDLIGDAEDDATRDALMIAAAQKVEHYEIAAYGTLRTWANVLERTDVAGLLEETLEEEKETDQLLTRIAESSINAAAATGEHGEEGEEDEEEPRRGRTARGGGSRRMAAADRGRSRGR
jgi:ferritin-like metal-binding protein YciE